MSVSPVAITGMGCVCAAGADCATVRQALYAGMPRPALPEPLGAEALAYPMFAAPEALFAGGRRGSTADTLTLARHAALEAIQQAGLRERLMPGPDGQPVRLGVVLGTTAGTALHFLQGYAARKADVRAPAPDIDDFLHCNTAVALAEELAGQLPEVAPGPVLTLSNACTSGADAVGLGAALIRSGRCDVVLCGGADALSLVPHTGFARLTVASTKPCRPFDVHREGLNLGEGAGVLVLESPDRAAHARVVGQVAGYGAAADAHHFTAPHPEGRGLRAAMRTALDEAGCTAAGLAFVNAHGTATRDNDLVEGRSVGACLPGVPLWASKGGTGHTLGAAGALEAVLALLALHAGRVPPSPGFAEADPAIGVAPSGAASAVRQSLAMSLSLGFGGGNAALVLAAQPDGGAA